MFLVFFFFKQKTAYELRISDWSSDVCSSDLKTLVSKKPTWRLSLDYRFSPDILGYLSYNRGVKSGGFALGTSPSNNFGYQPEQLNAYEGGLKIGRASCRERVCQYV